MRPVVVLTNWVHPEVADFLASTCEVITNDTREPLPPHDLARRAAGADALMAFMTDRVDDAFLAGAPRLRVIACALKGADNFDFAACARRGVTVTIVPDLLTAPTAELTIGLAIALGRHIRHGDALVRSGGFRGWRPTLYGRGLAGSRVGVVGQGAVGRALVAPFLALGAHVSAFDARVAPAPGADAAASLDALLATSDLVALAVPLTPATHRLIDARALERMRPGALLVNPARGSIVDEEAVADALEAGHLGGYAADVFAFEDWAQPGRPEAISPRLLAHPATVFTPHLGSAVDDVRRAIAMSAAQDILDGLAGRTSPNTVTPAPGAVVPA